MPSPRLAAVVRRVFQDCRPFVDYQAALIGPSNRWLVVSQGVTSGATRRSTGPRSRSGATICLASRSRTSTESGGRRTAIRLAIGRWDDIPERLPALPAPGQTHSSGVGKRRYRPCWRGSRAPQKLIARRQTMALNPISEDLDPLLWAKRQSQCALSLLRTGAAEGSGGLRLSSPSTSVTVCATSPESC